MGERVRIFAYRRPLRLGPVGGNEMKSRDVKSSIEGESAGLADLSCPITSLHLRKRQKLSLLNFVRVLNVGRQCV